MPSKYLSFLLAGVLFATSLLLPGCAAFTAFTPMAVSGGAGPAAVAPARVMTVHDSGDHAPWYRWNQAAYAHP